MKSTRCGKTPPKVHVGEKVVRASKVSAWNCDSCLGIWVLNKVLVPSVSEPCKTLRACAWEIWSLSHTFASIQPRGSPVLSCRAEAYEHDAAFGGYCLDCCLASFSDQWLHSGSDQGALLVGVRTWQPARLIVGKAFQLDKATLSDVYGLWRLASTFALLQTSLQREVSPLTWSLRFAWVVIKESGRRAKSHMLRNRLLGGMRLYGAWVYVFGEEEPEQKGTPDASANGASGCTHVATTISLWSSAAYLETSYLRWPSLSLPFCQVFCVQTQFAVRQSICLRQTHSDLTSDFICSCFGRAPQPVQGSRLHILKQVTSPIIPNLESQSYTCVMAERVLLLRAWI